MAPTNSQLSQQYMKNKYPCIQGWINFAKQTYPNSLNYDAVSCVRISMIARAAMKAFDYMCINDTTTNVIRVSRMMNDLQDSAWIAWTTYKAQSKVTTGTRSITLSPSVLQSLSTFANWDSALVQSPTYFNPPALLNTILSGVTV